MKKTTLGLMATTLLFSSAFGAEDLGEIIVTSSTKLPQKIKNSTANATVITAEDIQERGYQSVPEILSHEAGFSFASNGGAGQPLSYFIRGLSSDNLLILLDGIPLTDYTQPSAAASLEHISLSSVEKIEIIKGGQSGIWGASAAAGTINIITKGSHQDRGSITLHTGSHNTYGIGVDFAKHSDIASFSMGMHRLQTDAFSSVSPENAEADGYINNDYHIKASVTPDTYNTFTFFLHHYQGEFDFDGMGTPDDALSKGDSEQLLFGLGYRYQKEDLTVDAKLSHRTIDRHLQGAGNWGPWTYDTEGSSTYYTLTGNYAFSPNNSLQIGTEHTINTATTDSGFGASSSDFTNNAIFGSYTHSLTNFLGARTTFNAVLRYDNFDTFDNKTTYRFGIKRDCNAIEGLHSSANIYTGYKAPSLYQYSNAANTLKPESTEGYELSIGYKKYLNFTYFHNKIKDKIDANYDPSTYLTTYFNNGDGATSSGIELSSEYAFGESGFIAGFNWTHMIDYEDESGKSLQRVPQNSINAYLDYYFGEASHIGVNAKYVGKRRDLDYNTWPANDVTLKSYTTVDLTYNTQINDHFSLSITAKNIFDKQYETIKGYSTEGRSIYATMEYRF